MPKNILLKLLTLCLAASLVVIGFLSCFLFQQREAPHSIWSRIAAERERIDNFRLTDSRGRSHELYRYSDARAIVLIWHGNGCPIVRQSIPALRQIVKLFSNKRVMFFMINANTQDSREDIAKEARDFGIDLPILKDEAQWVTKAVGIERTAQAVLINPADWSVVYRGPIDDRVDYGSQKPKAAENHLADALSAFLKGKEIKNARLEGKGCLIDLKKSRRPVNSPLVYTRDIAPILEKKCLECHVTHGIAPWAMTGYEKVRQWAPMIREVIRTERMPPWSADPHFGTFSNDRSLSLEEKMALVSWIEDGAPRGEGPDPLADRKEEPKPKWPLGEPDLVIEVPEQKIPSTGVIEYRHPKIDFTFEKDLWLRAVEFRPGNPKVFHHGLAHLLEAGKESPTHILHDNYLALYVPGSSVLPFPAGTGKFIPRGSKVFFTLHYVPTGKPETDKSEIALYFHKKPPAREFKVATATDISLAIPPHKKEHRVQASYQFTNNVLVYALRPHMHYRGQSMSFEAHYPDSSTEMLLSVPNYNFNWQIEYYLSKPKFLPAGTEVVCRATFDNSAQNPANPDPNATVRWGRQSWDEMMVGRIFYVDEKK